MPIAIGMEQQVQVRGADGSILWVGTAIVGAMYHAINTAAAVMAFGEGAVIDYAAGATFIARLETTAAAATPAADLPNTQVLKVKRVTAATDICFLGVALEPIGTGKTGLIAGAGSICTVLTTTGAVTIGNTMGGTSTLGLCHAVTRSTTLGITLGTCIKANTGTPASPGAGTGSTSHAGILVMPC